MIKQTVNTGYPILDSHLIKFEEISVLLQDIINNKTCSKDLSKVFYKVLFIAEDFFLEVELLLNKLGYPKLKEQKKLHKDFIEHVKDIELDYNNGVTDSCGRLNKILTEKCINYFNANNQEIYSFLKEKGNI